MERGTEAFRRGNYHGRIGLEMPADLPPEHTFYGRDYREGYRAAKNEIWWSAVRAEKNGQEYIIQ